MHAALSLFTQHLACPAARRWGLGVLTYVLLTGRQPFSSPKTDDPMASDAACFCAALRSFVWLLLPLPPPPPPLLPCSAQSSGCCRSCNTTTWDVQQVAHAREAAAKHMLLLCAPARCRW